MTRLETKRQKESVTNLAGDLCLRGAGDRLPTGDAPLRRGHDDKVENLHDDKGGKSHVEGEENQVDALVNQPSLQVIVFVKVMVAYSVVMLLNKDDDVKGDGGLRHGDAVT